MVASFPSVHIPFLPCLALPLPAETAGLTGSRALEGADRLLDTLVSPSHLSPPHHFAEPAVCVDQVQLGCVEERQAEQCTSAHQES